ncbi:hypothetical protein [Nocardioides sp.]|uniref:DUF7507 domain-containing protein n=1 Tax=Nocardioides sp. TaxID=35761 RepID=UPI003526F56E
MFTTVDCPVTTLAPAESTTCTASYTLTQADVDAGQVDNTATVTGTDPNATDVSDTDTESVPITAAPDITLDKQAGVPSGAAAGDTIDYSFVVTNSGNVTLDPVTVADSLVSVTCPAGPLAPGDSVTCGPVSYTLTQVDVDSGHVANTATVTGTDPNGTDVDATDSTDTAIPAGPAISLVKTGRSNGNNAGDSIDYEFLVTNTGNVTLTSIVIDDPMFTTVDCPVTTLAPTESTTCTASYTLTQADVDAGQVDNTATVTGTDPNATDVTDTDTESVSIPATPAITLVKTGTLNGSAAGDSIDYEFLVTNTGT